MLKRAIDSTEYVKVYRNLHKQMLSVMDKTGRVIGHVHEIVLKDASFIVRPAGRKKVLETKRKNVHAFVRGQVVGFVSAQQDGDIRVSYNPYRAGTFMNGDSPVYSSPFVVVRSSGQIWVRGTNE
jgi:sporulation protein YlmC with PRC-barrel domain